MSSITYISRKGINELKKLTQTLEKDRHAILAKLQDMANGLSHDERLARAEQLAELEIVEEKLAQTQATLAVARPQRSSRARFKVALGSVVDLVDGRGKRVRYTIVDTVEANPSDGRISAVSPIGQRLLGKTVHDIIEWSNGLRSQRFKLINIR